MASPVINTEDHPSALIEMSEMMPDHQLTHKELRKLNQDESKLVRIENHLSHLQKKLTERNARHTLGGISDPVDKWFWIWVISWGLGILLTIIFAGAMAGAALGIIWLLAFGLGSVALVLWLVKKFGS